MRFNQKVTVRHVKPIKRRQQTLLKRATMPIIDETRFEKNCEIIDKHILQLNQDPNDSKVHPTTAFAACRARSMPTPLSIFDHRTTFATNE
jgi:hypothetical protein